MDVPVFIEENDVTISDLDMDDYLGVSLRADANVKLYIVERRPSIYDDLNEAYYMADKEGDGLPSDFEEAMEDLELNYVEVPQVLTWDI